MSDLLKHNKKIFSVQYGTILYQVRFPLRRKFQTNQFSSWFDENLLTYKYKRPGWCDTFKRKMEMRRYDVKI